MQKLAKGKTPPLTLNCKSQDIEYNKPTVCAYLDVPFSIRAPKSSKISVCTKAITTLKLQKQRRIVLAIERFPISHFILDSLSHKPCLIHSNLSLTHLTDTPLRA